MTPPPPSDEYSLLHWVRHKSLEAHNTRCCDCQVIDACNIERSGKDGCVMIAREQAFDEVAAYIENGRVNQRPHIFVKR